MLLNKLSAISPVDGRYRPKTKSLSPYFSEFGLIQYRLRIEVEYFIALCDLPLPELKDFPESAIFHFDKEFLLLLKKTFYR